MRARDREGRSLERGGNDVPHESSPSVRPFITDTLAPGGGPSEVQAPGANGFDWGDAGIGAGATAGLMLALLASLRLTQRRSAIAV